MAYNHETNNSMLSLAELSHRQGEYTVNEQQRMAQLFSIVGIPSEKSFSREAVVEATQPWVRGDHGYQSYPFAFSDEQKNDLLQWYDGHDMLRQRDLLAGQYDHILLFGAIHLGNNKRARFLHDMLENGGVEADRIVLLGGERKIFPNGREDEDLQNTMGSLAAKQHADTWLDGFRSRGIKSADETEMLRAAALDHLGSLQPHRMYLNVGLEQTNKTSTPVTRYDFSDEQDRAISLLHSRATPRKDGEARHTTESCLIDWLAEFDPSPNARVAIIGSQPHLSRMALTVHRALANQGREDVQIIAGGPGTTEQTGHSIFLGEVAREQYELLSLGK